jgi:hypothetical protein
MIVTYSKYWGLFVASFIKEGTLFTGRATSPDVALALCYGSVKEYVSA